MQNTNWNIIFKDIGDNTYFIRPIQAEDKSFLASGLKEMSIESRRQRFQSGKNAFSEEELKYLTEVDQITHMAFVISMKNNNQDLPVGVIRGIQESNRPNMLEVAITILDQYQHRGIGKKLMEVMSDWAIQNNFTHFTGDLHNSNEKMVRLLEKFSKSRGGMTATHVGNGFLYFEISLKK